MALPAHLDPPAGADPEPGEVGQGALDDSLADVRSQTGTAPPWNRWYRDWSAAGFQGGEGRGALVDLAAAHLRQEGIEDSLTQVLERAATPVPADSAAEAWARERFLEGLVEGDPRFTRIILDGWREGSRGQWNADGQISLPATLLLAARNQWPSVLHWIDGEPIPDGDRPYAISLGIEARLALTDTSDAGRYADEALGRFPDLPAWLRTEAEQAGILAALAARDTTRAREQLQRFSGRTEERGWWLIAQSRLAGLRGEPARADSILWLVAREYPGGPTAGAFLTRMMPGSRIPGGLRPAQARVLFAVAEQRGDLSRMRSLAAVLGEELPPASSDSFLVRMVQAAYRARDYDGVTRVIDEEEVPSSGAAEFCLVAARATRNTGRIEVMTRWYGRTAELGDPARQADAYWEWAREMEAQERWGEADSLYGQLLRSTTGRKGTQAAYRRGLVRFMNGDAAGAIASWETLMVSGDAEEVAAAWFWTYRARLALGDLLAAREALNQAADDTVGYYGARAASALELASWPGGPPIANPHAYWTVVDTLGRHPELTRARAALPEAGAGRWLVPEDLRRARVRLFAFRQYGRRRWAAWAKEEVQGNPALGTGRLAVVRMHALGLPDLATRIAIRGGSRDITHRYPTPFAAAVAAAAEASSVAPEWLWSLIRRESFFESSAVSSAGATGLMQLMETTAAATAQRHGIPAEPLRSPRVNLGLGTAHLSDLLEEASGEWPVVLAAYNAGMHNARRWRSESGDLDLYIERIGYWETREYVQRLLEGYWIYRAQLREDG